MSLCKINSCDSGVYAKQMCHIHYERHRRFGRADKITRSICDVIGCEDKHYGRGKCRKHYLSEYKSRRKSTPEATCRVQSCSNIRHTRLFCQLHYYRWKKFGSPFIDGKKTVEQRFWENVKKSETGCWEWQGLKNEYGYGRFSINGKPERAHRVAWFLIHGEFPKLNLLHSCDNPACVNTNHLREGTQLENSADMMKRCRHHTQKKRLKSELFSEEAGKMSEAENSRNDKSNR